MPADRWLRALVAGGRAALASKGAGGTRCKLTVDQLDELQVLLDASPAAWGVFRRATGAVVVVP
jgi:putative transposase